MSRKLFSLEEKICLQELIIKYKLNSTSTLTVGNQATKKNAWRLLTEEYNSIETNCQRNEAQLKKCWDNLKTRKKASLSVEKRQRMGTGGGPYQPGPSSQRDPEFIEEALVEQTDVEISSVMDSDYVSVDFINEDLPILVKPIFTIEPETELTQRVEATVRDAPERPAASQGDNLRQHPPPHARATSQLTDYSGQPTSGAKNVRAHVINEEFNIRQKNYTLAEKRLTELHELKLMEHGWLVKAAEELYNKTCIEKNNAELTLQINEIKLKQLEKN